MFPRLVSTCCVAEDELKTFGPSASTSQVLELYVHIPPHPFYVGLGDQTQGFVHPGPAFQRNYIHSLNSYFLHRIATVSM